MFQQKTALSRQTGMIHLLPLFVILIVGFVAVILVGGGMVKLPSSITSIFDKKQEPTVEVKSDYKNPFAEESQYVNPFDQYKSPFLSLQEGKK